MTSMRARLVALFSPRSVVSRHALLVTIVGLLLAVFANRGWAVPIAVTAEMFDSGFFHEDGRTSKEDGEMMGLPTTPPGFANYHVGLSAGYGIVDPDPLTYTDVETRNFFVFDFGELLAPFGGEVPSLPFSATLYLYNPGVPTDGLDGYLSPDASETYVVADAGSLPAALMDHYDHPEVTPFAGIDESGLAAGVFYGLASGPVFGSAIVSAADNGTFVEIPFTTAGLDYLTMELGEYETLGDPFFAFGGKLTSIGGSDEDEIDDPYEEIFAYTHPNGSTSPDTSGMLPYVEITFDDPSPGTVPEPSTLVLSVVGLLILAPRRARRI
jgi:hypothetical protein